MSSATAPLNQRTFEVSNILLFSLYSIIPVTVFIALYDYFFLSSLLLENYLPSNPATLMWWAIIFNFPHIVSSIITIVDDEYLHFYKKRFTKALGIIVVAVFTVNVILPMVFPPFIASTVFFIFFVFFAAYTMYHVLSQQFGIGMMMMKVRPNKVYEWWRYLATFATTAMYGMVFAKDMLLSVDIAGVSLFQYVLVFAGIFVALAVSVGFYFSLSSQRQLGSFYVYANLLMLIVTYIFMVSGYDLFVLMIPRFVHDLTAFIIYSTHDHNRNLEVKHNYIYRFLSFIPLPPLLLCPLLAIAAASFIECGTFFADIFLGFDTSLSSECVMKQGVEPSFSNGLPMSMQIGMQVMFVCGLFHYYIEGFVWKREAIHRHSVSFH